MKYLILFFSLSLLAGDFYIDQENLAKCHNGEPYRSVAKSETSYKLPAGLGCDVASIQDVSIDNPEKPIYALKTDFADCQLYKEYDSQADDCRSLNAVEDIGTEEEPIYQYTLCTDKSYYALYGYKKEFPETFPEVTDDSMFAYCTKLLGYEQKIVKKLQLDAALFAAKEAKKAADALEAANKLQQKEEAKTTLNDAKGKIKDLSKEELNALIEQILILLGD